jgi:hypothetical protein
MGSTRGAGKPRSVEPLEAGAARHIQEDDAGPSKDPRADASVPDAGIPQGPQLTFEAELHPGRGLIGRF